MDLNALHVVHLEVGDVHGDVDDVGDAQATNLFPLHSCRAAQVQAVCDLSDL